MEKNKLLLNDNKTECLLIYPNKCTQTFNCTFLSVGHNVISFSTTAKNIRFYLRDDMRIDAHLQDIYDKAYINIHHISSIRHSLSIDAVKTLFSAFVPPKLDYCNSLFRSCPMYMLERLQNIKNSAAKLIFQCHKQSHISPLLKTLHWLPIKACIDYKLSVICHTCFLSLSPI